MSSVVDGCGVGIGVLVGSTVISCAADVVGVVGGGVLVVGGGDVVVVVGGGDVVVVVGNRVQFPLPPGAKPALHTQAVALVSVC